LSQAFSEGFQVVPSLLAHSRLVGKFFSLKKMQSAHLASNLIGPQLFFIARF
jgi:hypothetical protein